jgi:hypothetical protein
MKSCSPLVPYKFKSGALLVSHNGFINFFFQLSNDKPTQVFSAPAGRQDVSTTLAAPQRDDLNSAFENADRLLEQKRTGSQFHSFTILRH